MPARCGKKREIYRDIQGRFRLLYGNRRISISERHFAVAEERECFPRRQLTGGRRQTRHLMPPI